MKFKIKKISKLEKDIVDSLSGEHPVIVLDTGALIDISQAVREYNLPNGNGRNPNYFDPTAFLEYLSGMASLVVTPGTSREIYRHSEMRLNGHTFELPIRTAEFALDKMVSSTLFISDLEGGLPKDKTRYDTYWTTKECCKDNEKKLAEGCSETDREILEAVAYLSSGRTVPETGEEIGQTIVLSSDSHVISGATFLKNKFNEQYKNISPISTRYIF